LLSAVIDHPDLVGIGIDEKTAILVHGTRFEVVGASNVLVVDARDTAPVDRERNKPGAVRDLGLHVLRAGMSFDLARDQR
jgi:cyanophycinase